jgi:hypothetical protein
MQGLLTSVSIVKDKIVTSPKPYAAATLANGRQTLAATTHSASKQPTLTQGDLPKQEQVLISSPYQTYS